MRYKKLQILLKPFGIEQIGRLTSGDDSTIMLGRPQDAVFPFKIDYHSLYAPAGEDDFYIDPEEIAPLLRRFKISMDQLQAGDGAGVKH